MLKVIRPGLLTSMQDGGRTGFQKHGVIVSGVMDPFAHRIANLLVGNEGNEATLELSLMGDAWEATEHVLLAICGADMNPMADGVPLPMWKPVWIRAGTMIKFSGCRRGARAYVAIAGGFQVPLVMNSRSTYLRAGIGGYQGRALQKGDELKAEAPSERSQKLFDYLEKHAEGRTFYAPDWGIAAELFPRYDASPVIRVIRGNQYDWFTEKSRQDFFQKGFRVNTQSDRMGYRLDGPVLERIESDRELISEAVTFGTVQVPAEGNPIVLLADRQTTGGYPKIAQIVSADLPLIAQTKPGDTLYFREIAHQEAERLLFEREQLIQQAKLGIQLKYM
ncbi:biotin-dependent carboxyltransferase family protein [Brevibacillus ruminantium]|uniref:Biotin-dependent carboxyltransferase family protein n=2 Tax=Brevibacillus ruminantium TaxID=2950604 RepID=A0ABY4WMX9_9BACL|nr:biotin-dependent carboxyltransferase family protein [Brevibacillus ruminantium]